MDVGLKEFPKRLRATVSLYGRVELYINTNWKQFRFTFPIDALFACVFHSASCNFSVYSASESLLHNIVCSDKQQQLSESTFMHLS